MEPKPVVYFDLFDTLVTVDRGYLEAYFDRETDRMGDNGTLKDARSTIERLVELNPDLAKRYSIDQMSRDYEQYMKNSLMNIRPGVIEMLEGLKAAGYKLCIISDAAEVDIKSWQQSPLAKYFDETVFSCKIGIVKPDLRLFEYAQSKMGALGMGGIYIGDGGHDELIAAKVLRMDTIKAEYIKNRRTEDINNFADYHAPAEQDVVETAQLLHRAPSRFSQCDRLDFMLTMQTDAQIPDIMRKLQNLQKNMMEKGAAVNFQDANVPFTPGTYQVKGTIATAVPLTRNIIEELETELKDIGVAVGAKSEALFYEDGYDTNLIDNESVVIE